MDLVEINPPLIVGVNIPAVIGGRALDLPPALVYRIGVLLLVGSSLWASAGLLRRLVPDQPGFRHGVVLLVGLVLFPMPGEDFGQREHLTLALFLPYLLLVALRARGIAVPARGAAALGAAAGIGVALKPHFLLVWLALELYRSLTSRSRHVAPAPEITSILAVLFGYTLLVVLATPEYLVLVKALGPAYIRFLEEPLLELLTNWAGALTLLAFLSHLALRRRARQRELWDVLLVGSIAFFLAGVLQRKGLSYHFYPSFGLATLFLGVAALEVRQPLSLLSERVYRIFVTATVLTVGIQVLAGSAVRATREGWGATPHTPFGLMVETVRRNAAGGPIFVFSYHIGSTFPLVNYAGVKSASRFPHLWILAAEYAERMRSPAPLRYRTPAEMGRSERLLHEAVLADLQSTRPRLLLVYRNARDDPANGLRRFDYLAYFGRDPRFAEEFDRYEALARIGEYLLYRRLDEGEPRTGPMPAATPGTLDVEKVGSIELRDRRVGWDVFAIAAVFFLTAGLLLWRDLRSA